MKTNSEKIKELQDEINTIENLTFEEEPLKDYIITTNSKKIKDLEGE